MESEKTNNSAAIKTEAAELRKGEAAPSTRLSLAQRALLLLACCGLGLLIGFIGQSLTSQAVWYLAVPVCIAVAWLFVADPNDCVACDAQRPRDDVPPR